MATINHLTGKASTANAASYATDAFTPTAGALLCVLFTTTDSSIITPPLSCSDGTTFTKITLNAGDSTRIAYAYIANAVSNAVSQTITVDTSADNATGCIIEVFEIVGLSKVGSAAIRQSKNGSDASGDWSLAFSSSCLTDNPTVIFVSFQSGAFNTPSGWTQRANDNYATPTAEVYYWSRDSGFTSTTISVTASGSASGTTEIILLEFDASSAAIDATLTATEAADTLSAAGQLAIAGTVTVTEAADILTAQATIAQAPVTGSVNATEAADTLSGSGVQERQGSLSVTEAVDTLGSFGSTLSGRVGGLDATEAADTLTSAAVLPIGGTLAKTEAADTLISAAVLPIGATLSRTETADTLNSFGSRTRTATLAQSETADTLDSSGILTDFAPGSFGLARAKSTAGATTRARATAA